MSFSTFGLNPQLLRALEALDFTTPTPIQTDAIPPACLGRDVLACAMTGSGKTAAFLLPIMQRLLDKPRGVTRALVLAPTRELAAQIDDHRKQLARFTRLDGAPVFGGVAMGPQEAAFRRGVDILVATPGRLLDHFQYPYARLNGLEVLVLDEADRMLDMGFLPSIQRIMRALPATRRQTLLLSATLPPAIVALSRDLLIDPVRINVERTSAPAVGISHAVYPVAPELKLPLLVDLLTRLDVRNALVFTRTKHRANRLADGLSRHGVPAERIHGNRSQAQRTRALDAFREGRARILVATDIAARGIDVTGLSHVVNFDVPHLPEDYIHRVGRTARAEAVGDAITLVSPEEEGDLRAIERAVGAPIERVTVPGFDYTARAPQRLEVPLAERIAAIRARKAVERERAARNAARRERVVVARPAGRGAGRSNRPAPATMSHDFFSLTPDRVLDAVEIGGLRCTGRCLPLRAFENRVYEVELEDERRLVVKFYRPGRWSREAILDEHEFLAELAAEELPAVPPVDLGTGTTLAEIGGIFYAAFPKVRGRTLDEADDERLRQIGRLIGRMHAIGAAHDAPHRPRFTLERYVTEPVEVLVGGGIVTGPIASRYKDLTSRIVDAVAEPLGRARAQRIHGDLHWSNAIWGSEGPILLDFDDFLVGPPVQDLWLLSRGDSPEARHGREQLVQGYEVFREFDRSTLALCEPLRALRIIYISGWIARRWDDPSFRTGFPTFGTDAYWAAEYEALYRIFESL